MANAGIGDNIDPEREKLFFYHRRKYVAALAAKKAADAAMKNCGKAIKVDLGDFGLDEIKDYETALTPEGQERLKAKSEATLRALRLAGMPVGTQIDMFEDRAPLVERAATMGREAGMRGDALANPYNEASEEGRAYSQAWHEGQEAIFAISKIKDAEASGESLIKGEGVRDEAPKKRGRPKKAQAGAGADGETPDDDKPDTATNGMTNAEHEGARQAAAMFN